LFQALLVLCFSTYDENDAWSTKPFSDIRCAKLAAGLPCNNNALPFSLIRQPSDEVDKRKPVPVKRPASGSEFAANE
jgi:hypothetical protein